MKTYRVLKYMETEGDEPGDNPMLEDLGTIEFEYSPSAKALGEAHGEGRYLTFDAESSYAVTETSVLAETTYVEGELL